MFPEMYVLTVLYLIGVLVFSVPSLSSCGLSHTTTLYQIKTLIGKIWVWFIFISSVNRTSLLASVVQYQIVALGDPPHGFQDLTTSSGSALSPYWSVSLCINGSVIILPLFFFVGVSFCIPVLKRLWEQCSHVSCWSPHVYWGSYRSQDRRSFVTLVALLALNLYFHCIYIIFLQPLKHHVGLSKILWLQILTKSVRRSVRRLDHPFCFPLYSHTLPLACTMIR